MSAQRARSAVAADHRSAHPSLPGVPWWGAVLIAITATAIGFAFDAGSGSKELSAVFAACYALGCIGAVLAVRQAAVFTAVIQPPLILFASVPTAYFLFTSGQNNGLKDLAINCGYPLIERFPLMFFTSAGVLLLGMFRWYYGMSARRAAPQATDEDEPTSSVTSALTAKISALFARGTDDEEDEAIAEPPRRRRAADSRTARSSRSTSSRGERPARRSTPSRSRHVRPPETEIIEPITDRPRRSRSSRQAEPPSAEPRRRPRTSNPRQPGPPPSERRSGYERPERRRRFDDYDFDYQPREPHGRNGRGNGDGRVNGNGRGNGSSVGYGSAGNGTHHPISRVRYRGEDADDRVEYRTRRRSPREREADSWEYDI